MSEDSFSTLERVLVLKSAEIFAETPEDVLAEISGFLIERHYRAGTSILRKGELGTSMYLIVHGRVRVHDGDRTLTELGERTLFGELALLDPQPRNASVTALSDVHLFILEQAPFYELLAERPEVVRGLFQVLARRIRDTSARVAEEGASRAGQSDEDGSGRAAASG